MGLGITFRQKGRRGNKTTTYQERFSGGLKSNFLSLEELPTDSKAPPPPIPLATILVHIPM